MRIQSKEWQYDKKSPQCLIRQIVARNKVPSFQVEITDR